MKKAKCTIPLLFLVMWIQAQTLDPLILSTAGDVHSNEKISIAWTVGEIAITTDTSNAGIFTEGFHQPILQVTDVTEAPTTSLPNLTDLNVSVFPNPVQSILQVKLRSEEDEIFQISLIDQFGKELIASLKKSSNDDFEISMENLSTGTYFLRVQNAQNAEIKVFKISKIN